MSELFPEIQHPDHKPIEAWKLLTVKADEEAVSALKLLMDGIAQAIHEDVERAAHIMLSCPDPTCSADVWTWWEEEHPTPSGPFSLGTTHNRQIGLIHGESEHHEVRWHQTDLKPDTGHGPAPMTLLEHTNWLLGYYEVRPEG